MRVYFLSKIKAAIKLNGVFLGYADTFERHVELNLEDEIFAEFIPEGEYLSANFFIDKNLLTCPPSFLDVYLLDGDVLLFVREYAPKNADFVIVNQTKFCQNLVTVFMQGKVKLSFEGKTYFLIDLPDCFKKCEFEQSSICGFNVLIIKSDKHIAILSDLGKLIFLNKVEKFETGNFLKVLVSFETCTKAFAECKFLFDGKSLTLTESKTIETIEPNEEVLQFAFFESVLICSNFKKYMSEDLQNKAQHIKEYLGDFCDVTVPPEKFFTVHGDIKAAGLVYPKGKNLFKVKYFAVETENGKICNIFPVE